MALIQDWYPPSRENYEKILWIWTLYPLFASLQWAISWYGMGKTSVASRLNLPGRIGWMLMECPGFLTLLYIMNTLPKQAGVEDLPWQNRVLAGLFVMHYTYRAVIFPLIQPSMSPIHILVYVFGTTFQLFNATCIASWLAAYGPLTTSEAWRVGDPWTMARFVCGIVVFFMGLLANYFHDDELRDIRWREMARRKAAEAKRTDGGGTNGAANGSADDDGSAAKHYAIPQAGLFRYVLYAHYLVEWIEWTGFWMACGWGCAPARNFVMNEVTAMLPRAVRGKWWYLEKFGEDKVGKRWAVLPGIV